ncbi:hypothetical protein R3P38DRAFT_3037957 [Favolaschia claudopus]|uniref:F-box domain-containing protein n=1 Tax=Favolaschia claudopus TaxID=2862362 RepID=A0AAW0AB57_9AGAR
MSNFSSAHLPTSTQIAELRNLLRFGGFHGEIAIFRAAISAAAVDVDRYDSEIEKLPDQAELNRLISERHTLTSYIELCRSVLSPIHRLPNELLELIFGWCFPSQAYKISSTVTPEKEVERLSRFYLLELSRVCSRWSHIAMQTPQLWSDIVVDTRLWDRCPVPVGTLLDFLESSLDRGREHPLSLEVCTVSQHHSSVFNLISRHAPRWKAASIWGTDEDNVLRACIGNFGRLEKLTLAGSWKDVETFQTAPRLRELIFSGSANQLPKIPWTQIQRCGYLDYSSNSSLASRLSLLSLLTNAANVKFALYLQTSTIDEALDLNITTHIRHIQLELSTTTRTRATACQFLDNLTFPSLLSFCLHPPLHTRPPVWSSPHFLRLATRSGFAQHLIRLVVHVLATETELLRCLEALPNLKWLSIMDCTSPGASATVITDLLLQGLLSVPGSPSVITPQLHSLTLNSVLDFTDSLYVDLVASRAESKSNDEFHANLWWLETRKRDVSAGALNKIAQLMAEKRLIFNSGEWRVRFPP